MKSSGFYRWSPRLFAALLVAGVLVAPQSASAIEMVTISGTVTSNGLPVKGMSVGWDPGVGAVHAETDAAGAFTMAVTPGSGRLGFTSFGSNFDSNFVFPRYFEWRGYLTVQSNTVFNMVLPTVRNVTFQVTDEADTPISNARVVPEDYLRCATPSVQVVAEPCFWTPSGGFTNAAGEFTVAVFDQAETQPFSFFVVAPEDKGVVVADSLVGADTTVPVKVLKHQITGVVYSGADPEGRQPEANIRLMYRAEDPYGKGVFGVFECWGKSQADGSFSITVPDVPGQLYAMVYRTTDLSLGYSAAVPTMPNLTSWTEFQAAPITAPIELTLPTVAKVAVNVVDDVSGDPVEGASIAARDSVKNITDAIPCTTPLVAGATPHCSWEGRGNAITNSDGNTFAYMVAEADTGPYAIIATHPTSSGRVGSATGNDVSAAIRLPKANTISGKVTLADGTPVQNARMQFINYTANNDFNAFTNSSGEYSIEAPPGTGYMYVYIFGQEFVDHADVPAPVSPQTPYAFYAHRDFIFGSADATDVDLVLSDVTTQTIKVVDSSGNGIAGARVHGVDLYCGLPAKNTAYWSSCAWEMGSTDGVTGSDGSISLKVFAGTDLIMSATDPNNAGRVGRIDVQSAGGTDPIEIVLPDPPAPPTNVDGTAPDSTSFTVSWQPPDSTGGSPITGYEVTADPVEQQLLASTTLSIGTVSATTTATTIALTDLPASARTGTLTGLVPGKSYTISVRAKNAVGVGQPSQIRIVAGQNAPAAPAPVNATAAVGSVGLSWTAPSNGGSPITDYEVRYAATAGALSTAAPVACGRINNTDTCRVERLTGGTNYYLQLRANNGVGKGAWSATVNATPTSAIANVPAAPSGTPDNAMVTLSWTEPTWAGAPITGYTVQMAKSATGTYAAIKNGTCSSSVATLSCTATGLTNGTAYFFKVRATNARGSSAYSVPSTGVIPATRPSAPAAPTGVAADQQVTLTWKAPSSNGGSAITGYVVTISQSASGSYTAAPGGTCAYALTGSALSCVASGLANGTQYFFKLAAINAMGTSPDSLPSAGFTPGKVPDAPGSLSVTAGTTKGSLYVSWSAPLMNGSSLIRYEYTYKLRSSTTWKAWATNGISASLTITKLTSGALYDVRVRAVNGFGVGAYAAGSGNAL